MKRLKEMSEAFIMLGVAVLLVGLMICAAILHGELGTLLQDDAPSGL